MEVSVVGDSAEIAHTPSHGLDDLYKATLSDTQTYELPFPIQTVECSTSSGGEHYEIEESNSVLDMDKGQVQIIQVSQSYTCDSQILQQYLNDGAILRADNNLFHEQIIILPETRPPTMDDFEFNSSDSFSSTESIIPKNIQCPKCPKRFMFKSDLTRHDKHKHSVKQKLTCTVCKKEFFSQQNLRFHEKSHRPSVDITCAVCKKTFKSQTVYNKHMTDSHKMGVFYKEIEPESKAIEMNVKTEPHICDICNKAFRRLTAYKAHILKHKKSIEKKSTEKVYLCQHCPASLGNKTNLDLHIKLHDRDQVTSRGQENSKTPSGKKIIKIPCPHCSKLLSKTALKLHLKTAHKAVMQESCTQTGEDLTATFNIPNINMVLHPAITAIDGNQSIIITPVANFGDITTISPMPMIFSRPAMVASSSSSSSPSSLS